MGWGEVEGVGVERVEGRVVEGFGTLVRVEGGWGEEVGGFVLREEMVSLRHAILFEVEVSS